MSNVCVASASPCPADGSPSEDGGLSSDGQAAPTTTNDVDAGGVRKWMAVSLLRAPSPSPNFPSPRGRLGHFRPSLRDRTEIFGSLTATQTRSEGLRPPGRDRVFRADAGSIAPRHHVGARREPLVHRGLQRRPRATGRGVGASAAGRAARRSSRRRRDSSRSASRRAAAAVGTITTSGVVTVYRPDPDSQSTGRSLLGSPGSRRESPAWPCRRRRSPSSRRRQRRRPSSPHLRRAWRRSPTSTTGFAVGAGENSGLPIAG